MTNGHPPSAGRKLNHSKLEQTRRETHSSATHLVINSNRKFSLKTSSADLVKSHRSPMIESHDKWETRVGCDFSCET